MFKLATDTFAGTGIRRAHAVPKTYRASSLVSDALRRELTSRRIPVCYDYLSPQPSHLLDLTINDSLTTATCRASGYESTPNVLPSVEHPPHMKVGHHLVYFPPQVSLAQLLPDGTDILHTPGHPFNRRLWAGGRVRFPLHGGPLLDGSRAVCLETIRDTTVKGRTGEEKVFVKIERRIGLVSESESEQAVRNRMWREDEEQLGDASIIESRDLVFMREKTEEQLKLDQGRFGDSRRTVPSPSQPAFRHTITPTRAMLFRFSALTFNAHSIHLDRSYVHEVEGYRNLLVHGPLSLVLLLSVLRAHLSKSELEITEINYRNVSPLYVDEQLTVCGKPKGEDGSWEVWIENQDGGLAVRGRVRTARLG